MPVVIDEAISRQSPPNDPASVAAMVPFDSRFAYFRTAAFVVGLLRLDQKIVTRRADVIESRGERARHRHRVVQEFYDRLSVYGDRTLSLFAAGQAVEVPVF
jgi:hypothetical protein